MMMMMEMMKKAVMLVICVSLFSSVAVQAFQGTFGPEDCCFIFISHPLPVKRVVSIKHTDKLCPMQGVLFTMVSGKELCVDPSVEWVKKILEAKERV